MKATLRLLIFGLGSLAGLHAEIIGGVDFPMGAISFADSVFSYSPVIVNGEPTLPFRGANNALGVPNVLQCTGDMRLRVIGQRREHRAAISR